MFKTPTQKLGIVLFSISLLASLYALFLMPPSTSSRKENKKPNTVIFHTLSPQQEAVIMTSGLLIVLGVFCIRPSSKKMRK